MPERPLLIFPTPQAVDVESRPRPIQDNVSRPSHGRQGVRVSPMLTRLKNAFDRRAAEIQSTPDGTDPSQVIVVETIGSVKAFATAVRNLEGMEWLGEFDIDEIVPDEDFYEADSEGEAKDKMLRGRLYLAFSNQAAMQQLLTLWRRYQSDANMQWPYGLTGLRDVFNNLYTIRRWEVKDRLIDSGVLQSWSEDVEHFPDQPVRTEIELWYRNSQELRTQAQTEVERLVASANGSTLQSCEFAEIGYHALLVELPRNAVAQILANPATDLVKCDSVMFFRPTGQVTAGEGPPDEGIDSRADREGQSYPSGDPIIGVLDGLPVENHALLADRLIVEDPDNLAPNYPVRDRRHGTCMCSLLVWGDLSEGNEPLSRPVYVRPIMVPQAAISPPFPEAMPSDQLVLDYVHRVVKRMYDGEGEDPPSAPTVKVLNLSIGDRSRPFLQMISPLARLLDWLSYKYSIVFVISAGNQDRGIDLGVSRSMFEQMSEAEKTRRVFQALYRDSRHRHLLSPAESINGVTVNATHHDSSGEFNTGRLVEAFQAPLPSPVSSFGSGYRRAIKPDVAFPGGRALYDFDLADSSLQIRPTTRGPGHETAFPGTIPGESDKTAYSFGTSNAAALVSRHLAQAHETLQEIFAEQAGDIETAPYVTPLLKALLVHSSHWGLAGDRLGEALDGAIDNRVRRSAVSRLLGYGVPDIDRIMECTGQRVTVLGFGALGLDKAHSFEMPLPPGLSAQKTARRLTVTLAWLSPIAPTTQLYRTSRLWFDLDRNRLTPTRQEADHNAVRRGTVQHEIFEGDDAIAISRGDSIEIKVSCKQDARPFENEIPYGLAVSLEVAEEFDIQVYDEIRDAVRSVVDVAARNPVR